MKPSAPPAGGDKDEPQCGVCHEPPVYRVDLGADGALHFCESHVPDHLDMAVERVR